jgi:hypothetical protein
MATEMNKTVVVNAGKSVVVSILLTFFFGPLGMFYSTVLGAVIMLVLYVLIGIVTLGLGLIVLHPIAIIWGAIAVSNYNKKLAHTL